MGSSTCVSAVESGTAEVQWKHPRSTGRTASRSLVRSAEFFADKTKRQKHIVLFSYKRGTLSLGKASYTNSPEIARRSWRAPRAISIKPECAEWSLTFHLGMLGAVELPWGLFLGSRHASETHSRER